MHIFTLYLIIYRRAFCPTRSTRKLPAMLMPCPLEMMKDHDPKENTLAADLDLRNHKCLVVALCLLKTRCFNPKYHMLIYYKYSDTSTCEIIRQEPGEFLNQNGLRPNYAITYDNGNIER